MLKDVIAADPEAFLGPEHVASYGADPALLVKLLDAGERLPVHYHPGRAFAKQHLGPPLRQDRGVADARGRPRRRRPRRPQGAARPRDRAAVGRGAGRRNDARRPPRGPGQGRRRGPRPRRHAARDRRRDPAARAAGADRPLGPRRVEEVRRRQRPRAPRPRLGHRAAVARPRADRPRRADQRHARPAAQGGGRLLPRARRSAPATPSPELLDRARHRRRGRDRTSVAVRARAARCSIPYAAGETTLEGDVEAIRCLPPDPTAGEGAW